MTGKTWQWKCVEAFSFLSWLIRKTKRENRDRLLTPEEYPGPPATHLLQLSLYLKPLRASQNNTISRGPRLQTHDHIEDISHPSKSQKQMVWLFWLYFLWTLSDCYFFLYFLLSSHISFGNIFSMMTEILFGFSLELC